MPTRSCFDADGQPPVYEIEWPEPAEVAALCCNDYKPRIGETSYRCIIRDGWNVLCLLYTSPSPRDGLLSRMPSSA